MNVNKKLNHNTKTVDQIIQQKKPSVNFTRIVKNKNSKIPCFTSYTINY